MTRTASQLIARSLQQYGVPYVAGIPGHGNWALTDALNNPETQLPFIQVMHEQSAAHMADAHFRLTGQPAAVMASIGPGAANTIHGLATAYCDSSAFLLITGSAALNMRGHGVMQAVDRKYVPDFPRLAEPVTKACFDVVNADSIPSVLHRAFSAMMTGRPGPAAIDVPLDQQVATTAIDTQPLRCHLPTGRIRPDSIAIESALQSLLTAERPCIVAGGGVLQSEASDLLRKFAESIGCPVTFTWNGKGAISEDHPLCVGPVGVSGSRAANETTANADVLLALGCRFTDWSTSSFRKGATCSIPPTRLIHVDIDPSIIGRSYPVETGIVADVSLTLEDLLAGISRQQSRHLLDKRTSYLNIVRQRMDDWSRILERRRAHSEWPPTIPAVLDSLRESLPRNAIVTVGSGHCQGAVKQCFPVYEPRTHITSGGFSSMGFAVPAAMAAKLAYPQTPVVCIVGDGDMLMSVHELATCAMHGIAVIFLVLNNSGFMSIRDGQKALFGRSIGSEFRRKTDSLNTPYTLDFAAVVRSFGIDYACSPQNFSALRRGIGDALGQQGPALVEVAICPDPDISAAEPAGWWDFPPAPDAAPEIHADHEHGRLAQQHLGADTSMISHAPPLGIYG